MTCGQTRNFSFEMFQDLHALNLGFGALEMLAQCFEFQCFEQVKLALAFLRFKIRQIAEQRAAHLALAMPVENGIGQNALEQQRQLLARFVGVFGRQADHRLLHQIHRGVVVARRERGAQKSALVDAGEEFVEFSFGGHRVGRRAVREDERQLHIMQWRIVAPNGLQDGLMKLNQPTGVGATLGRQSDLMRDQNPHGHVQQCCAALHYLVPFGLSLRAATR
ncbi:hypothetical protein THICB2_30008 [Thiomonas sp. CB2]|nr:hypothetical protein THICB2_30008 [Thiomonas sp. CB2]